MVNITDFIPKKPPKKPLLKAIILLVKKFFYLLKHTLTFYYELPTPPNKQLPNIELLSEEDAEKHLALCKDLYNAANDRFKTIQSKAQQLLGIFSLIISILGGILTYTLKNRASIASYGYNVELAFTAFIAIFLFLSIWAILRCMWVTTLQKPFINSVVDIANISYKPYSSAEQCIILLECTLDNEVINDHIADYLRAAQLFFGIAIILFVINLAMLAIIISCGPSDKLKSVIDSVY